MSACQTVPIQNSAFTMKVSVPAAAPVMPPETGASTMLEWATLHSGNGRLDLCSRTDCTAAATCLAEGGSMVEQSISKEGPTPSARDIVQT